MSETKTIKVTKEDYKLLLGYLEEWNCNSFSDVVTKLLQIVTSGNFSTEQINKITKLVTKTKEIEKDVE